MISLQGIIKRLVFLFGGLFFIFIPLYARVIPSRTKPESSESKPIQAPTDSKDTADTELRPYRIEDNGQIKIQKSRTSPFGTTSKMRTETRYLVTSLERLHYLNKPISQLDVNLFIREYMKDLDYNHLFFLQSDYEEFKLRFGAPMLFYLHQGNLYPAFQIFDVYRKRALKRLDWVLKRLEEDFSFNKDETYSPDRSKFEWPSSEEEADKIWVRRLKYELLNEILLNEHGTVEDLPQSSSLFIPERDGLQQFEPIDESEEIDQKDLPKTFKELLDEAREPLVRRYTRAKEHLNEIEAETVQEIFLTTLAHMYDRHSNFFSVESLQEFAMAIRNSLTGIGAVLSEEDGHIVIRELLPGGPAQLSGKVLPQDTIVGVAEGKDGEFVDIVDMKLRKAVKLIRGQEGTVVRLLLKPADALDPSVRKEVTLIRKEIQLTANLAKAKIFEVEKDGETMPIGVIELPSFYGGDPNTEGANTTKDVNELISKLKKIGIEGLILDLRYNLGGLLSEAISLSGLFIPNGPVLQIKNTMGQMGQYVDEDPYIAWKGPLIILVSRYSASSSEIVAGALRNHRRALLVGDSSTHGKGTVQAVFEMDNNNLLSEMPTRPEYGAAKITIQKYFLPDGNSTQLKGVPTDIKLPSINEFLPIGESDLPNALSWDHIEPIPWKFAKESEWNRAPVSDKLIRHLGSLSKNRQENLSEFEFLRNNIEWFKEKQDQKEFSLNYELRKKQKAEDRFFREKMEENIKKYSSSNYPYEEILLDVSIENKDQENVFKKVADEIRQEANNRRKPRRNQKDEEQVKEEEEQPDFDPHLREGLRIMADWVEYLKENQSDTQTVSKNLATATPEEPAANGSKSQNGLDH